MRSQIMRARQVMLASLVVAVGIGLAACAGGSSGDSEHKSESKAPPVVDQALVSEGKALATSAGCSACHSTTGSSGVGPTWKGLWGHSVALSDGTSVTADDPYIRESITNPNAKVVKGFAKDTMPATLGQTLKDRDIQALTEYIKSLQ